MITNLTKHDLVAFEDDIKEEFLKGNIRAPIHLSDPNQARHLLRIFQSVQPDDWVFSTWRCHFHALLKGVPPETLKGAILAGRSMFFCSKQYRFITSALVGGCLPIAVGLAAGIKRNGGKDRIWCFIGDMARETGIFHETSKYAFNFDLPITFVVEDNGLSTNTNTEAVWGHGLRDGSHIDFSPGAQVMSYPYKRNVPHTGAGQWVVFQ